MVTQAVAGMQVGSDTTVAERLDKWLDLVADELSPTTLRGYRGVVRGKIVPALGAVKIRKLRPSQIDALYLALVRDEGLAPATVRQVHAVLRRTLSQAVKWGWIQANPAVNASPPRSRRPDIRPPDLAEVRKLIAEADASAPDFATFLRLMVATGLRRGEACALRWSDLDVDAASLLVERAIITVTGKGTAEKDTKTHAARRIALDPGTLGVLLAHHAVVEERGSRLWCAPRSRCVHLQSRARRQSIVVSRQREQRVHQLARPRGTRRSQASRPRTHARDATACRRRTCRWTART